MKSISTFPTKILNVVFLFSLLFSPFTMSQTAAEYPCITWKKLQSTGPNLKQIGLIAVRHSKDIKSSPWSVGCETLDRDQAIFSVYKKYVGELGVKHARLQSGWAKCEKQKGVYDFAWLDECVYGLSEQGVNPWICLCYGNSIYGSNIQLGTGIAPIVNSKEALAAWLKYVETTVKRYKGVVKVWEIWNEPYHQEKDYVLLLIPAAEIIKKIQPEAIIYASIGSWEGFAAGNKLILEKLKAENKLNLVDYWAYHPYNYPNPDDCYSYVEVIKKLVQSYNPNYKLYQGECGCPAALEWTHAFPNYPWTEYSQAKWNLRLMAGDKVHGIPSSIFTIIDLRYPDMLQSFGLIRSNLLHQIIYRRPSYYAVQHMAGFFDDAVKPVGELLYESNAQRKMTVAGFEKERKSVALVWYKDKIPSDDLIWNSVDLTIKGVNYQDPVYVEMITGKVYKIDKSTWKSEGGNAAFKNLPVWDSPVMIVERSLVELREIAE